MKFKTILLAFLVGLYLNAQEADFDFGVVSRAEVAQTEHHLEKDAEAAILYKYERVFYEYNAQEGFRTLRDVHFRIKIYNKSGLDWGTLHVPLYNSQNGTERISSVKGYTYNIVNGKIQEAKLEKKSIFNESVNRYWKRASIAMPQVREGSVIEVKYRISSDFAGNLDDFQFQYGIPVNKVDVSVEIPQYYVFKRYGRGYYPIDVNQTRKNRKLTVRYREEKEARLYSTGGNLNQSRNRTGNLEFFENVYKINTENIPSLKEVEYTDNIDNYRSAIKFELASIQFPNSPFKNYSLSWEDVAETIYQSDEFGGELGKTRLVKDIVDGIKSQSDGNEDLMSNIFDYVKSNITWNSYVSKFCENGIKKTLSEKTGNVADINITLVTMLKQAGFDANPILVSTKSHGIPLFPTREGFNYVVAAVNTDKGLVFMDATEKTASIGVLPLRAINWYGRLVKEDGSSTEVVMDTQKPSKKTIFINANILEDGTIEGKMRNQLTGNYAFNYRESHKDETLDDIMNEMEERYVEMEVDGLDIKNQQPSQKPIVESCEFVKENQVESISGKMYLKPSLFLGMGDNPFKLEKRDYPVDFGFSKSDRLTVNFVLPEGYQIESIPQNAAFGLPDGLGVYKYTIRQNGNQLQFSSTTEIKKAVIPPNYYPALKEFYNQIVVKQNESVVLSKI